MPISSAKQSPMRRLLIPVFLVACCPFLLPPIAHADPQDNATIPWIQTFLDEFSLVLDTHPERGREFIATQLTTPEGEDTLVLVYERSRYSDPKSEKPDSRQRIHYPFELRDLNPDTLVVRSWTGPLSGNSFHMVLIEVTKAKGFVDYSNIVEERLPDGSIDVTSSRGKARTLALGYFSSEENARRLADTAKQLIDAARSESAADVETG